MSDETVSNISPHLVELPFAEDIQRLTNDFTGREWVFEQIDAWVRHSCETFFILTGEAGVGKSAIAARLTQLRDDIAAHHFCIAGRNTSIVPGAVLRSIAAQLGRKLPDYGLALAKTIKPTYLSVNVKINVGTMSGGQITGVVINNLTTTDPKQEIETLLTAPLSAMPAPAQPVLILLDSLDEAFTYNPNENLVTLLAGLNNLPSWVRIILTSRPEARVLSYFGSLPTHVVAAESQMNREDLRRYVGYRVSKSNLLARLQAAPTPSAAEALVEQVAGVGDDPGLADGNFLYTKILLNDIERGVQPLDDLAALPKSLDEIYHGFLLRLAPEWETRYQPLLAVLAVAREPLTREQLLRFSDQSARLIGGRMNATLVNLALGVLVQFLDMRGAPGSEIYSLFHQSLRDYLGKISRSGGFACPPEDGHGAIADSYWQAAFDQAAERYNWSMCDKYGLAHLPAHLDGAEAKERLRTLHFDYDWLQAKLDRLGVSTLLADFNLGQPEGDGATLRLRQALEQGAHVLDWAPAQLAPQLFGRLLDDRTRETRTLLTQTERETPRPWLRPLNQSLAGHAALTRTLEGHTSSVTGVAISRDGMLAVSASYDTTLKVWDISSGRLLHTLKGHRLSVNCVAIADDQRLIISGSDDKTLKVWDLISGNELRTFEGHLWSVNGVAVSSDGRLILSTSDDNTIKVWDVERGKELRTLKGHAEAVKDIALSGDRKLAVSASNDKTLKVWDVESGRELRTLTGHTDIVMGVDLSEDGRLAVSASYDKTLKVWDVESGRELRTLTGHKNAVKKVAISTNGRLVVSASYDNTLKVWDVDSGREIYALRGHVLTVNDVALNADKRLVVSASEDRMLKVWNMTRAEDQSTLTVPTSHLCIVAISGDGSLAVSGMADGTINVWDVPSGKRLRTIEGHTAGISHVALSADGNLVISASEDKTIAVWEVMDGKKLGTLKGHTDSIRGIALNEAGTVAISISADLTLKVWELTSKRDLRTLPSFMQLLNKNEGRMSDVALSGDGGLAISASSYEYEQRLDVWDVASGEILQEFLGLGSHRINKVDLSADGRLAISASDDKTLNVWDVASGKKLKTLEGHTGPIYCVSMSRDGRLAVSASNDNTLMVWDVMTGSRTATLVTEDIMISCAMAHDGVTMVAGGASGHVYFLRLEE